MRERFLGMIRREIGAPPGGPPGADPRQDERAGGSGHHRRALRGLAGRRADRPDRARHLLPPSRAPRRQRDDPGDQHRRAVPRALAGRTISSTAARRRSTSARPTGCRAISIAGSRRSLRSRTPAHRQALRDVMLLMWQDNRQAWELRTDGTYRQRHPAPWRARAGDAQVVGGTGGPSGGGAEGLASVGQSRRFGELLHQVLLLRASARPAP